MVATLGPTGAERFITTPPLCTEIIEDSLPRMAHLERTHLPIAVRTGLAQPQVMGMRAHLEATRGHPTPSPAAIAELPLTGALKVTEPTQATGDSPADMPAVDTAAVEVTVAADTAASAKCSE